MKSIQFTAYGEANAFRLADAPEPQAGPGQVVVALEAAPLNPSDFMVSAGHYPFRPELPTPMGSEAVGRVLTVGPQVPDVQPGDRVLVLPSGVPNTWQERFTASADRIVVVPATGDPVQLATVGINAATAYLLLQGTKPNSGAWVAVTAGNSDVAAYVYALAQREGLRTIGVVRSEDAAAAARKAGADEVVLAGDGLADRVRSGPAGSAWSWTGWAAPRWASSRPSPRSMRT